MLTERIRSPTYVPRDVKWTHRTPQWFFALSKPPPLIREEYQSLVEHIRCKGRIDDVSACGNNDMFDRPIYESDSLPPLDKNAPERLEAQKRAEARQAAIEEQLAWFNSPEQKKKRLEVRLKREADRDVMLVERERQEREYNQRLMQRAEEQARRDAEWNQRQARLADTLDQVAAHNQKKQDDWAQHLRLQSIFKGFPAPAIIKKPEKLEWSTPGLHEISVWWSSGRLLFLEPNWQPAEPDWYRISSAPLFTVRNAAGLIASMAYDAPKHEEALVPLLRSCEWPV